MLGAACPATGVVPDEGEEQPAEETAPTEPSAETLSHQVGIAQFFTAQDSRTLRRRGRAYEATEILAAGKALSEQGYDFVLAGRLRRLPNGRVIACASPAPTAPPACIASAEFGRAWIERPDNGEIIAQWGGG
jgi:hypothetical protein